VFFTGNPFSFMVNDPSRVVARGEGLGSVKCGQATSFAITAQGAQLKDIDVRITGLRFKQLSRTHATHTESLRLSGKEVI
jgi:hypothetical protein